MLRIRINQTFAWDGCAAFLNNKLNRESSRILAMVNIRDVHSSKAIGWAVQAFELNKSSNVPGHQLLVLAWLGRQQLSRSVLDVCRFRQISLFFFNTKAPSLKYLLPTLCDLEPWGLSVKNTPFTRSRTALSSESEFTGLENLHNGYLKNTPSFPFVANQTASVAQPTWPSLPTLNEPGHHPGRSTIPVTPKL